MLPTDGHRRAGGSRGGPLTRLPLQSRSDLLCTAVTRHLHRELQL